MEDIIKIDIELKGDVGAILSYFFHHPYSNLTLQRLCSLMGGKRSDIQAILKTLQVLGILEKEEHSSRNKYHIKRSIIKTYDY